MYINQSLMRNPIFINEINENHVPPGIWASEQGFSSGSICLVLASEGYSEDDYIRNYDDYLDFINQDK